jgi:hypothetical protein
LTWCVPPVPRRSRGLRASSSAIMARASAAIGKSSSDGHSMSSAQHTTRNLRTFAHTADRGRLGLVGSSAFRHCSSGRLRPRPVVPAPSRGGPGSGSEYSRKDRGVLVGIPSATMIRRWASTVRKRIPPRTKKKNLCTRHLFNAPFR